MRLGAAFAVLIGMALLAPAVLANGDRWEDDERRLEVQERPDGFELRSDHVTGGVHDRIRLQLDGGNARFDFDLMESPGATESEASLRVEVGRIVEFRDRDADGAFNAADDVVQQWQPSDLGLLRVENTSASLGGVPGVQVTASYALAGQPAAQFLLRVTAVGNVTTFEGLRQSPVEIKHDLVFKDFPYSSNDTLPAIQLRLTAEAPGGPSIDQSDVSFTVGNLTARFAWKDAATVDGVARGVHVTTTPEGGVGAERVVSLAFAYARGANITHDPTFAFARPQVSVGGGIGTVVFYVLGVVAAVAVIASLAVARRGRKPKGP